MTRDDIKTTLATARLWIDHLATIDPDAAALKAQYIEQELVKAFPPEPTRVQPVENEGD